MTTRRIDKVKASQDCILGVKKGSLLGIYTNFAATPVSSGFQSKKTSKSCKSFNEKIDKSSGEILRLDYEEKPLFDHDNYRIQKYMLQAAIRRIMFGRFEIKEKSVQFRVTNCCRALLPDSKEVDVLKTKHEKAVFSGLMMCSSIWVCPVCGSKITERRALEVGSCVSGWIGENPSNVVLMLTFTFPHHSNQPLRFLMDRMKQALKGFSDTRAVRDIKRKYGFFEAIKSPEVTYGDSNGWHPHQHELWFLSLGDRIHDKSELTLLLSKIKEELFPHWVNYCSKRGLDLPSFEHGLDVRMGENAEFYISKMGWSLASEVTKTNLKKSKISGRFSPFDLAETFLKTGNKKYKKLFQEYACSTHGYQFLSRFPKLKNKYLEDEKDMTDEEIALSQEDENTFLGSISFYQWQKILDHSSQGAILALIDSKGWDHTQKYIRGLEKPNSRINVKAS